MFFQSNCFGQLKHKGAYSDKFFNLDQHLKKLAYCVLNQKCN